MKNSTIIDYKILEKAGISPIEFLYLVAVHNAEVQHPDNWDVWHKVDIRDLEGRMMLKIADDGKIVIREEAKELIDYLALPPLPKLNSPKIIKKSKKQVTIEVTARVEEFRARWAGLKAGSMGSKKDCINKLVRWILENPTYSFGQILNAADAYIESVTDYRYLQRADYFIFKQDVHKSESSNLSAFIDDIQLEPTKDWTTTLK